MKLLASVLVTLCVILPYSNSFEDDSFIRSEQRWWKDTNAIQSCRYRNLELLYPPEPWRYLTGAGCFTYTDTEKLTANLTLSITYLTLNGTTYTIPFLNDSNGNPVLFDYTSEKYIELIRPLFLTDRFMNQWIDCAKAAVDCCQNYLNDTNMTPTDEYPCPALWDGWTCVPQAKRDSTVYGPCPSFIYTSEDVVCPMNSEKYCLSDGTWNHSTNYLTCSPAAVFRRRNNYHVAVLSASLALTIPAMVIYLSFKRLWTFRIALNRNLLASIIIKNILTIMSKEIIILDSLKSKNDTNHVMDNNGVGCKALSFIENVSKTVIFTCMLVVGYFLHKTIARVFDKTQNPNLYLLYFGVLVVSIIPSTIWAILMETNNMGYCWMVDNETKNQWITDGFKYCILAVNLLLLLDIIRVLVYRRTGLDAKKLKSAVKATLFLIPLFGVPMLFTGQRDLFKTETCRAGDIYSYVTYAIEAAQGIAVAVLFCYMNNDVHLELKRLYIRFHTYMEYRWKIRLWKPQDNSRRKTATTNVRATSVAAPVTYQQQAAQNGNNKWESFT